MFNRMIALATIFCLVLEQSGFAQAIPPQQLALPAYLRLAPQVIDRFRPVHIRSITFDNMDRISDVFVDKGDSPQIENRLMRDTYGALLEYFQIGLQLPNDMFWVNLRPDAPGAVIDPLLEKTDVGRIFLETDVQLKKDVARFTDPSTREGRQYWDRLYKKAEELFEGRDAVIPTVTRPWIVPGEIILNRSAGRVDIYKATIAVMLEEDYIGSRAGLAYPGGTVPRGYGDSDSRIRQLNSYSTGLIRELIIPRLTREINASKRYAAFRQVYYSLILAQYIKACVNGGSSAPLEPFVDSKDISGLASRSSWSKDQYYKAYLKSVSEGEYSKEETLETQGGVVVRQYVSGGISLTARDGGITVMNGLPGYDANTVPLSAFATRDGGETIKLYHAKIGSVSGFFTDDDKGRIVSVGVFDETENIDKGAGLLGWLRSKFSNPMAHYDEIYIDGVVTKGNRRFKILSIDDAGTRAGKGAVNLEVKLAQLGLDGTQTGNVEVVEAWKVFDEYRLPKAGEQFEAGSKAAIQEKEEAKPEENANPVAGARPEDEARPEADGKPAAVTDTQVQAKTDDSPEVKTDIVTKDSSDDGVKKEPEAKNKDEAPKTKDAGESIWGAVLKNSKRSLITSALTSIVFGAASASVVGFGAALLATIPVFLAAALVPILVVQYYHQKGVVESGNVALYTAEAMLVGVIILSVVTALGGFDAISLGLTWHQTAEQFLNNGGQLSSLAGYVQTGAIGLVGANFLGWHISKLAETPKTRIVLAGIGLGIGIAGVVAGIGMGMPLLAVPGITLIIQAATLANALFAGRSGIIVNDQSNKDPGAGKAAGEAGGASDGKKEHDVPDTKGPVESEVKEVIPPVMDTVDAGEPEGSGNDNDDQDLISWKAVMEEYAADEAARKARFDKEASDKRFTHDKINDYEMAWRLSKLRVDLILKTEHKDSPGYADAISILDKLAPIFDDIADAEKADEISGQMDNNVEKEDRLFDQQLRDRIEAAIESYGDDEVSAGILPRYTGSKQFKEEKIDELEELLKRRDSSVPGDVYTINGDGEVIAPAGSFEFMDTEKVKALSPVELLGDLWFDSAQQVWRILAVNPDLGTVDLGLYGFSNPNGEGWSGLNEKTLRLDVLYNAGKFASEKDGGKKYGGIDMRALPVAIQPVLPGSSGLPVAVYTSEMRQLAASSQIKDLRKEWRDIDSDIKAGSNVPYERIKEFYAVCSARPGGDVFKKLVLDYVQVVLRAEEDLAAATDPGMKAFMQYL